MRVIFMGRKPAASRVLRRLVESGAEVAAVVAPMPPSEPADSTFWRPLVRETAQDLGLPVCSDEQLYAALATTDRSASLDLREIDLVVSFLFWKKIRPPLIKLPKIGCFNFHPGPLPQFRGRRGYGFAILEGVAEYGATVHWVDSGFDEGDIVEVRKFPVGSDETGLSLEARTMGCLEEMFDDFIRQVRGGETPRRIPQGPGRTATKREMLATMKISPDDDSETIARKVRAFWYPPHSGATLQVGGREYTLVDSTTLDHLGRFIHGSRNVPW